MWSRILGAGYFFPPFSEFKVIVQNCCSFKLLNLYLLMKRLPSYFFSTCMVPQDPHLVQCSNVTILLVLNGVHHISFCTGPCKLSNQFSPLNSKLSVQQLGSSLAHLCSQRIWYLQKEYL